MIQLIDYVWVAALFAVALPLLRKTVRAALHGNFATDAIASMAIITAIILMQPLPGFIIVLMQMGGEALERMARGRATRALSELEAAAPRTAHRNLNNEYVDVPVDDVKAGERVLVRPGEIFPVDGTVLAGRSSVDTAQITGEPLPIVAEPGTRVLSGYWNLSGPLEVTVTHIAAESQYSRIVKLVREAQSERAPIQRLADAYAVWFTPFTLLLAIAAWLLSGDSTRVLAVLVVATPCPLLLATPVAMLGGINLAAKRKVIVRSGAAVERLASVRAAVFDKTGTLTTGRPVTHKIIPEPGWREDDLLRAAAAVELGSGHLLARVIVEEAQRRNLAFKIAENVRETPGRGLEGMVNGGKVAIGSRDFISETVKFSNGTAMPNGARMSSYIAIDGKYAGQIQFDDEMRPDAKALVAGLRALGVQHFAILSGDDPVTVREIADRLGIAEAHGDLKPEHKLDLLRTVMSTHGPTLMIGDGTNDAPALAAASVGLAVSPRGGGIATEAADVILPSDNLMLVADALAIARRTLHIARQSILIGLALSACGMVAAALGFIPPVAGALYQEAIDVGVILNALRASAFPLHRFSASPTP